MVTITRQHETHRRGLVYGLVGLGALLIIGVWFMQLQSLFSQHSLAQSVQGARSFGQVWQSNWTEGAPLPEIGDLPEMAGVIQQAAKDQMTRQAALQAAAQSLSEQLNANAAAAEVPLASPDPSMTGGVNE